MSPRAKRLVVRFSTEEFMRVRTRARVSHASVAAYIRDAALRHAPRAPVAGPYADLIHALNQIGLSLNAVPTEEARATLAELQAVLRSAANRVRPARRILHALDDARLE